MTVYAKVLYSCIFIALTIFLSFPLLAILLLLDKINKLILIAPVMFIGFSVASVVAEYYTTSHPIKIAIEDDLFTVFSLFRKISFKQKEVQSINLDKRLGSNDWGAQYSINVNIDEVKRTFILHKQQIKNLVELINIVSSRS